MDMTTYLSWLDQWVCALRVVQFVEVVLLMYFCNRMDYPRVPSQAVTV